MGSNTDHRKILDRRLAEKGPPKGWKERRRSTERRQIGVAEVGFEEWARAARKFNEQAPSPAAYDNPSDR